MPGAHLAFECVVILFWVLEKQCWALMNTVQQVGLDVVELGQLWTSQVSEGHTAGLGAAGAVRVLTRGARVPVVRARLLL